VHRRTTGYLKAATAVAGDKTPIIRGKKAADLLAKTFDPPREIVPGVLFEGLMVLVGKPKIGKSRLLLALAVAIVCGGKALGSIDVEAGDVLYISLEDHERRLQKRIRALLGTDTCPDMLEYEREWRRFDEGGLEDLELWIARHPNAKFIVIDPLKRVRSRKRRNGSAYDEDYEALEGLQDLCNRHPGLAIVVNHHENKMGAVDDWMDRASGSTGLTGAVDGAASLRRQRGSADAVLTITHRDIDTDEGQYEYALKSDHETGGWTVMGAAQDYQMSEQRRQIYDVLLQAATPMSPKTIAMALGKTDEKAMAALYFLLHKMFQAGVIASPEHGKYSIPITKDAKDAKDTNDAKNTKGGDPPTQEGRQPPASLASLAILSAEDIITAKDASSENCSSNGENLSNLSDLSVPEQNGKSCPHGRTDLLWEGNKIICGLCLGMPAKRIEILRNREGI